MPRALYSEEAALANSRTVSGEKVAARPSEDGHLEISPASLNRPVFDASERGVRGVVHRDVGGSLGGEGLHIGLHLVDPLDVLLRVRGARVEDVAQEGLRQVGLLLVGEAVAGGALVGGEEHEAGHLLLGQAGHVVGGALLGVEAPVLGGIEFAVAVEVLEGVGVVAVLGLDGLHPAFGGEGEHLAAVGVDDLSEGALAIGLLSGGVGVARSRRPGGRRASGEHERQGADCGGRACTARDPHWFLLRFKLQLQCCESTRRLHGL